MKMEHLRDRIEELKNVLLPFAGPNPRRGRRARALFVGLIPVVAFNQHPFDDAIELLKSGPDVLELEKIELLSRLGKILTGTNIYLDFDGKWFSVSSGLDGSKVFPEVYKRAPFELRLSKDGWAYPAPINSISGRKLKVKF